MRRVLLLRHGRTRANEEWLYCGSTDLPLSEKGREELAAAAREGRWPELTGFRVYTSGMRRTEETLEILFGPDYEIVPVLVLTAARDLFRFVPIGNTDAVLPVCSGDMLFNVFNEYLGFLDG